MTWICKKCGRIQSDSIIYSDEICEDCFEKINNKKKKGSAFNKILSLALVLSFMLCIFSGFGVSASAEETDYSDWESMQTTVSSGTYMGYDVLKYEPGTEIYNKTLFDYFDSKYTYADNPNQYLSFCLLDFDASGKPYIYTLASNGFDLNLRFYGNNLHQISITGSGFNCEVSYDPTYFLNIYMSWSDKFNFYTFGNSNPDNKTEYTRTIYCNGGEFTGYQDSDKYLLLVPYADANQATSLFNQLLTGTKEDFIYNTTTQPSANFYTCKSAPFSDSKHGLYVKSWLKDGEQYPYFGWWINDNGNNHKYKVVFSYNDTQKELFETFYNSTKSNPLFSDGWWIEKAFPIISVSKDSMIIANEMATQTGFADFMADKTWWLWHYNTLFTLEHSSMDFTNSTASNKIYTINLSDYSSIYEYLFYRAQIVDVTTGNILDTVYFTSQESYNKSDSGYGSKVYDYGDDFNGMIDDLINNNPSVEPDNQGSFDVDGDTIDSPIIDENGNAVWDNINIGGMYSPLSFGLSAVSDFFQSLWLIFPNEIKSIIISGISLIVILRILGR